MEKNKLIDLLNQKLDISTLFKPAKHTLIVLEIFGGVDNLNLLLFEILYLRTLSYGQNSFFHFPHTDVTFLIEIATT
jgi:hypothetical protein